MNKRKSIITPIIFGVLFLIFTLLVKTVDVQAIGPMGTSVGFAGINGSFHSFTGESPLLYNITEVMGLVAIAVAGIYALGGLIQLIRTRDIKEVKEEIIFRGVIYSIVLVLYILFELVVINYRPMIMPGDVLPEPSFPSTHTMLVCCVMGCTFYSVGRLVKNRNAAIALKIASLAVILITVLGRLFCGVHWLTDIVGGLLISACLVSLYNVLLTNFSFSERIR